jgi:hypothetical protein
LLPEVTSIKVYASQPGASCVKWSTDALLVVLLLYGDVWCETRADGPGHCRCQPGANDPKHSRFFHPFVHFIRRLSLTYAVGGKAATILWNDRLTMFRH